MRIIWSVAMLVMHFGHALHMTRQAIGAAIRPASAASHHRAMRLLLRPSTRGYRGLLNFAFGSPYLVFSHTTLDLARISHR